MKCTNATKLHTKFGEPGAPLEVGGQFDFASMARSPYTATTIEATVLSPQRFRVPQGRAVYARVPGSMTVGRSPSFTSMTSRLSHHKNK
jgi:hypothetical protein